MARRPEHGRARPPAPLRIPPLLSEFCRAVAANLCLRKLILHLDPSTPTEDDVLVQLFSGLSTCRSLEQITITELSSSSEPILEAVRSILTKRQLSTFRIGFRHDLSLQASLHLAETVGLPECNTSRLGFAGENVCRGWDRLATSAISNPAVEKIWIEGFFANFDELMEPVMEDLSRNTTITEFVLVHCSKSYINGSPPNRQYFDPGFCGDTAVQYLHQNKTIEKFRAGLHGDAFVNSLIIGILNGAGRKYMVDSNTQATGLEFLGKLVSVFEELDKYVVPLEAKCLDQGKAKPTLLDCVFYHVRENVGTFFPSANAS